jgi:hypothetical protein
MSSSARDEHQVDLYVADPLGGFGFDTEGMKAVFAGARQIANPERMAGLRPDLPLYITVGNQDPRSTGSSPWSTRPSSATGRPGSPMWSCTPTPMPATRSSTRPTAPRSRPTS